MRVIGRATQLTWCLAAGFGLSACSSANTKPSLPSAEARHPAAAAAGDGEPASRPAAADRREVTEWGAAGDGTADDTAAIQRAVDSGAGSVSFPRGVYRITRPIVIDLDRTGFTSLSGSGTARIVMAGPGPALRFVGTHGGTAEPRTVKADVWDRQRTPMVDALEVVGDHAEASGVEASGTMQLTITRLVVRRSLHGVRLTGRNRNVVIADSHLYDNRGVGIYYDGVNLHQSNVTGCHVSYNSGGGIVTRAGDVRNLHITGCDIEGNMSADGPASANVFIDSTGGVYGTGEVAITGCTIQHTGKSPGSANVRVIGRTAPAEGQPLVRQGNVTITGNVLSDAQVNLHLKDCRGVTVTGNTLWEGYAHNVLAEGCSGIVVGPNNLDRNPHYDRFGNAREARNGVIFRDCADSSLTGLHLTNVSGARAALIAERCHRLNITGCTILDCDNAGVLLDRVSASRVSGCLIRDDRPSRGSAGRERGPSLVVTSGEGNMIVNNLLGDGHKVAAGAAQLTGNYAGR